MKKEDIRQAYEKIPFTEGIEGAMYQEIVKRGGQTGRRMGRKRRLAPVLIGIALFGTTIYAAEKMDWFQWGYGEDSGLIRKYVQEQTCQAANDHLKMTVESSVFTRETGVVFLHIQALDQQGKEFMRKHKETVFPQLEMQVSVGTVDKSGSTSSAEFLKGHSDEENWYYKITAVDDVGNPESAKVVLSTIEQVEKGSLMEEMTKLSVKIPVKQSIGDYLLYENCGDFKELLVSPLSVTLSWSLERYADQEIELELALHDGRVLRYKRGSDNSNEVWDSVMISTDEENGLSRVVLTPKEILDLDGIERIVINGEDYMGK